MTETALEQGIRRCQTTLAKQGSFATGAVAALVLGSVAGLLGAAILFTGMAGGAMLGIAAAVGLTGASAVGVTGRRVLARARADRDAFEEALTAKILARQASEVAARQLRERQAAEKFNAAVEAGLPLETAITVKRALRLKFPPPPPPKGAGRVFSKIFGLD